MSNDIAADSSAAGINLQTHWRTRPKDTKTQPRIRSIERWPWYLANDISEYVNP
jgi:hypothetical protein